MRNTQPPERDCYGGRYSVTPVSSETFLALIAHISHVCGLSPVLRRLARPLLKAYPPGTLKPGHHERVTPPLVLERP